MSAKLPKLEGRPREIYEEAASKWIDRWEHGQLDAKTYGRLRRAERAIRSHSTAKKRLRQLDAEIAQALSKHQG